MSETLPGELRWEPGALWWEVCCAVCGHGWRWSAASVRAREPEAAARYARALGCRCIAARWHCLGCAR